MTDALKKLRDEVDEKLVESRASIERNAYSRVLSLIDAAICEQEQAEKPLQLREGGWYQRRDGEIVELERVDESDIPWRADGYWYALDSGGKSNEGPGYPQFDLIREVPAPYLQPMKWQSAVGDGRMNNDWQLWADGLLKRFLDHELARLWQRIAELEKRHD
jgi:hypothetical protein